MSQIDYLCCNDVSDRAEGTAAECPFRLCSPYPTVQVVILSNSSPSSDCMVPHRMVNIANQAVRAFELNPSRIVWIEHISSREGNSKGNNRSSTGFNLLQFDWQAGQATRLDRSPIYEDWYLSWLKDELLR